LLSIPLPDLEDEGPCPVVLSEIDLPASPVNVRVKTSPGLVRGIAPPGSGRSVACAGDLNPLIRGATVFTRETPPSPELQVGIREQWPPVMRHVPAVFIENGLAMVVDRSLVRDLLKAQAA
jgi:hypothetical protein